MVDLIFLADPLSDEYNPDVDELQARRWDLEARRDGLLVAIRDAQPEQVPMLRCRLALIELLLS